jgi:uncharacterized protein YjbI with pentapeptide repeats
MANKDYLTLLKQGANTWNQWRENNPGIKPDLSFSNLSRTNLRELDLSDANLRDVDFSRANLDYANLSRADLTSANFMGANLSRANLNGTISILAVNFSRAFLGEASLVEANLSANFSDADLRRANLTKANLHGANLSAANLSEATLSEACLMTAILSNAILSGADLRGADLKGVDLSQANLRGADLSRANLFLANLYRADLSGVNLSNATLESVNLSETDLSGANLKGADLNQSNLREADLSDAILSEANLVNADLSRANFTRTNLSKANLKRALLMNASLVETNFEKAILSSCVIYGISAWGLNLEGADQTNLIVTPPGKPTITVDSIEIAQFIYLLLNNENIRNVIETITSKVVLILGRFTPERKAVLDAIREELRKKGYCPVMFDFEKPGTRDFTETVSTLAHLARFIIADITDAKSIPQELQAIVPTLSVPVQPLIESAQAEYGMFQDFRKYPWFLEAYRYKDLKELLISLSEKVIAPAEAKAKRKEP